MRLLLLAACVHDGKPRGEDPGDDSAVSHDTGDRVELPPIGVVDVTELVTAENGCRSGDVSAWGLYDRPPDPSTFGLEWEYWGSAPEWYDGCARVTTNQGTCDPACRSDQFCNQDGACEAWPTHLDAGAMALGGLTADLVLEHTSVGSYALTEEPAADLFDGARVTLDAAGGETLPAFRVASRAPEPLDAHLDCGVFVAATGDLQLTWTPQDPSMRVRFAFGGVQHGGEGFGGLTVCEGPDDGEMVVPEALLGGYGASSWSFEARLVRFSRGGAAVGAGEVRLQAGSGVLCTLPYVTLC